MESPLWELLEWSSSWIGEKKGHGKTPIRIFEVRNGLPKWAREAVRVIGSKIGEDVAVLRDGQLKGVLAAVLEARLDKDQSPRLLQLNAHGCNESVESNFSALGWNFHEEEEDVCVQQGNDLDP